MSFRLYSEVPEDSISCNFYTTAGTTSTLDHVIAVAYRPAAMNAGIKVDEHALARGALLLLTTTSMIGTIHEGRTRQLARICTHPRHALDNAREDFPGPSLLRRHYPASTCFLLVPIPPHTKERLGL